MMLDELRHFMISLQFTLKRIARVIEEQETENNFTGFSRGNTAKLHGNNSPWIGTAVLFIYLFGLSYASGVNVITDSGQDAVLPCQTDPLGVLDVYWQKLPGNWVVLHWSNGTQHPEIQDQRYQGRTLIDSADFARGNLSLSILGVNLNDTGTYQCIIMKTQHVTPEKYSIRLDVEQPLTEPKEGVTTPGFDKETTTTGRVGTPGRHHCVLIGCAILPIGILMIICVYRCVCNARG
ncbi:hepatitis A virus cellular receptor 2-like isoform X2 [Mustelus asterias]